MERMCRNIIGGLLGTMLCVTIPFPTSAAILDVEDYCTPSVNSPKRVKAMTPLSDGVSYAAISDSGNSIDSYSYKTGEKTGTLFSISEIKGNVKIDSFEGYTISSNGKKILLWNNSNKIYRNSFTADYYVYDIMRGTLQKVSEGGQQRCALMSHDGRSVAYVRDNNIYISNLDYGNDIVITKDGKLNEIINGAPDWAYEEEFGMDIAMCWSGDDSTLAYIRFDEKEVPVYSFDRYKSYCEENPLSDVYPTAYSYKYPLAGYPNSSVQVFAYNVDNRVAKKMDIDMKGLYVPCMSFDGVGENLMVMTLNRDQNNLTLYRVNPGSTVAHPILIEKSDAWLSPAAYQMTKYHEKTIVFGSERTGYRHLYEYDYNGNLLRPVTTGNWNVTAYYGCDSRTGTHFVQTTQLGAVNRNVAAVTAGGKVTMLNSAPGWESASFSTNYDYFVREYSNSITPPTFSICSRTGKQLKMLEDNAAYAAKYSSAPKMELMKVKNSLGEEMDAYIIRPADFDSSKKYPLLMYQYNGPDSQNVCNRWHIEGIYYLASCGYIVASVDGRGTGNRDRAWSTSVYKHLGEYETEDQIAGARYFASLPYVDAQKTGCFGWSYGGYMTLMEMTAADSPFRAGVAMAPVTDWRFYDSIYTERYMQTPQQNERGYNSASALDRTDNLKGRLLIMSGTSDDNVHFYNTLKFTSKLNYEGKVYDMMALTGFEHSLGMCNARAMLFRKIADFLDKELK